jgi:membrane protein implicated in regulation of membrane protease activity
MVWYVWVILALALGVIELLSTTFVLLWIAVAALITGIFTLVVPSLGSQVVVFGLLSLILLLVTRRFSARWRMGKTSYVSRVEHLVGETGIVVMPVTSVKAGMVRIGSEVWSARAEAISEPISSGEWIEVVSVESSIVVVRRSAVSNASASKE